MGLRRSRYETVESLEEGFSLCREANHPIVRAYHNHVLRFFPSGSLNVLKDKGRMTPAGRPLRSGFCTCALHCSNTCSLSCCGENASWCDCECHQEVYFLAARLGLFGQLEMFS